MLVAAVLIADAAGPAEQPLPVSAAARLKTAIRPSAMATRVGDVLVAAVLANGPHCLFVCSERATPFGNERKYYVDFSAAPSGLFRRFFVRPFRTKLLTKHSKLWPAVTGSGSHESRTGLTPPPD